MDALDGNAIAGALQRLFGTDMTTATGACVHCGAVAQVAELRVYPRGPGAVARCRSCGNVVFVLVERAGAARIHLGWFDLVDRP